MKRLVSLLLFTVILVDCALGAPPGGDSLAYEGDGLTESSSSSIEYEISPRAVESGLQRTFTIISQLFVAQAMKVTRAFRRNTFEDKRRKFYLDLTALQNSQAVVTGTMDIRIDRHRIIQTSKSQLRQINTAFLASIVRIRFHEERGLDVFGLKREFLQVLGREIFHPNSGYFRQVAPDVFYTTIEPHADNQSDLKIFRLAGKLIALSLIWKINIESNLAPFIFKLILGHKITMNDLKVVDPTFCKSMDFIAKNRISSDMGLTFSVTEEYGGAPVTHDLVPEGRNKAVKNSNKSRYLRRLFAWKTDLLIQKQISAIQMGLFRLIPKELLLPFSEVELELLVGGVSEIDVDEWQAHTKYQGYAATDETIQYFWKVVRNFDHANLVKLLLFVTGSARLPIGGFKGLRGLHGVTLFTIQKQYPIKRDALPVAQTCFNTLILPPYDSEEVLKGKLTLALEQEPEFHLS